MTAGSGGFGRRELAEVLIDEGVDFCSSTTNFAASTSVAVSDCTDSTAFLMSSTSASTSLTTFTMLAAISFIVAASVGRRSPPTPTTTSAADTTMPTIAWSTPRNEHAACPVTYATNCSLNSNSSSTKRCCWSISGCSDAVTWVSASSNLRTHRRARSTRSHGPTGPGSAASPPPPPVEDVTIGNPIAEPDVIVTCPPQRRPSRTLRCQRHPGRSRLAFGPVRPSDDDPVVDPAQVAHGSDTVGAQGPDDPAVPVLTSSPRATLRRHDEPERRARRGDGGRQHRAKAHRHGGKDAGGERGIVGGDRHRVSRATDHDLRRAGECDPVARALPSVARHSRTVAPNEIIDTGWSFDPAVTVPAGCSAANVRSTPRSPRPGSSVRARREIVGT